MISWNLWTDNLVPFSTCAFIDEARNEKSWKTRDRRGLRIDGRWKLVGLLEALHGGRGRLNADCHEIWVGENRGVAPQVKHQVKSRLDNFIHQCEFQVYLLWLHQLTGQL